MLFSPARRDDADDFFATAILPICVNNQQHDGAFRLNPCLANCVPSLLPGFVHAVRTDEAAFIFEDQRRQLE